MVEVVNRQRRLKLDTEAWATFAAKALDAIGNSESAATIAFVSDKRIRELNRHFRGVDKATDVLSFPAGEKFNLGDIAVSVDTAAAQAKENGLSFEGRVKSHS
jgi:probable rRNA maturation factor